MRKVLFIDRDGTLIEEPSDFQVDRCDKVRFVEGVIPALLKLKAVGYRFVMISNQDGLGTATFPTDSFQSPHTMILDLFRSQGLVFDDVLICPHLPTDGCECRKPRLGLLVKYLKDPLIDWNRSAVIGDRSSDMQLAEAIGVQGFQLATGGGPWTWQGISTTLTTVQRTAVVQRTTNETNILVRVNLDGSGKTSIATGLDFFDHMLDQFGRHSGIDLDCSITGDYHIDDHHSVEDAGLALGEAMRCALSDKVGIARYGFVLPMDECRAEALLDFSGRCVARIKIPFTNHTVGDMTTEMIPHFFHSWAHAARANLHITVSAGNQHHMAESAFKAFARATRQAVSLSDRGGLPTTKGVL